jgi:hypothetical protein
LMSHSSKHGSRCQYSEIDSTSLFSTCLSSAQKMLASTWGLVWLACCNHNGLFTYLAWEYVSLFHLSVLALFTVITLYVGQNVQSSIHFSDVAEHLWNNFERQKILNWNYTWKNFQNVSRRCYCTVCHFSGRELRSFTSLHTVSWIVTYRLYTTFFDFHQYTNNHHCLLSLEPEEWEHLMTTCMKLKI